MQQDYFTKSTPLGALRASGGLSLPDVVGLTFWGFLRSTSSLLVGRVSNDFQSPGYSSSAELLQKNGSTDNLAKLSPHFARALAVVEKT